MENYFEEILREESERLDSIKDKFNNNEKLSLYETEDLFRLFQIENNPVILNDSRFKYFRFRDLYLIYLVDLDFKSIFYKYNPNKKVSDYLDYNFLEEINNKEYNEDLDHRIRNLLIKEELLIPINHLEIENDKNYLYNIAKDWAEVCLNERHSDEKLKNIAIETRDHLKKKNIMGFLNNNLTIIESKEIFKDLLKSYHIFFESIKILDSIKAKNEPISFDLNDVNFEINYYSFIHILYRHYGKIVSSQNLKMSKSFHKTKIDPYKIHLFIDNLVSLIKQKGIEKSVFIGKGEIIFIKFYENDYALCFDEYKHNKSKIILVSFFIIDSTNPKSNHLVTKIISLERIKLNNVLSIYIN